MPLFELPDQFLYSRKGPWPQPSPSHPMKCAAEVLNIPPIEQMQFNATIGKRYLEAQAFYPPYAGAYAAANADWNGVDDARFSEIMFDTLITRFLIPSAAGELEGEGLDASELGPYEKLWMYDFEAMNLIEPIPGTYCVGTRLYIGEKNGTRDPIAISVIHKNGTVVVIRPGDKAWSLAKIYVLQGASYHVLFVVHPALHFPMDAVNAITKSSVPIAHPLYQLLFPHTVYSLALDHGVLESAESVVNNNAQGTRFDPLTANAFNLKLLFGAGYTGYEKMPKGFSSRAYPVYEYMKPAKGFDSGYGRWLDDYYTNAVLPFCRSVVDNIPDDAEHREYIRRWAMYNHTHVLGFPDEKEIMDSDVLAEAAAIYLWDTTVSHGGDHYSFAYRVEPVEKCLRIRVKPPQSPDDGAFAPGDISSGDDLARAAICQYMFFKPWAIQPNLAETGYAFTQPKLQAAAQEFHTRLREVADRWKDADRKWDEQRYQPLTNPVFDQEPSLLSRTSLNAQEAQMVAEGYSMTIPQSIQY